jgi:hypothetical protein
LWAGLDTREGWDPIRKKEKKKRDDVEERFLYSSEFMIPFNVLESMFDFTSNSVAFSKNGHV